MGFFGWVFLGGFFIANPATRPFASTSGPSFSSRISSTAPSSTPPGRQPTGRGAAAGCVLHFRHFLQIRTQNLALDISSVAENPDPYVFRPPASGSISQRYGSGSGTGTFYHYLFDFLSLKNDVNVPSKSNMQKNFLTKICWRLESQGWKQQDPDPDPWVGGMDLRIRIHTKMSGIRNTAGCLPHFRHFANSNTNLALDISRKN